LVTLGDTTFEKIMASLYQRTRSPFWWLKFRNPATNQIEYHSTGFRGGVGIDTRKAQKLEAQKTLAERRTPSIVRASGICGWRIICGVVAKGSR
jgi:hypothetical protein